MRLIEAGRVIACTVEVEAPCGGPAVTVTATMQNGRDIMVCSVPRDPRGGDFFAVLAAFDRCFAGWGIPPRFSFEFAGRRVEYTPGRVTLSAQQ
ncbi:MAG: hypothetical protein KDG50_03280 [Chromatiales bacterium]|nr:hypothetical protein [Chromatiales bacterium]